MNNLILDWFSETHVRTFKRQTKNQEGLEFYDCGRASDNANYLQPSRASPGAAVEAGTTVCLGSWPEEEARGKLHANRTRVPEVPWYHWGDQDGFVRVEVQSKYVWNLKAQKSKNIVLTFVSYHPFFCHLLYHFPWKSYRILPCKATIHKICAFLGGALFSYLQRRWIHLLWGKLLSRITYSVTSSWNPSFSLPCPRFIY